jgi:hypothetical protein
VTEEADPEDEDALSYSYAPRPAAPPVALRLKPPILTVDSGRRVDRVRLSAVEQVRLTYTPRSFGQNAYRTKLTLSDGKTVGFASVSWKSMVEAECKDEAYRAFLAALLEAVAAANPRARFLAGTPLPIWLATVVAGVGIFGAILLLVVRAVEDRSWGAALLGLVVGAIGIVQIGPMLRLNRPGVFDPRRPPERLIP